MLGQIVSTFVHSDIFVIIIIGTINSHGSPHRSPTVASSPRRREVRFWLSAFLSFSLPCFAERIVVIVPPPGAAGHSVPSERPGRFTEWWNWPE